MVHENGLAKTFSQLTVGDVFFRVYREEITYTELVVNQVDVNEIHWGYSHDEKIPRFKGPTGTQTERTRYASEAKANYYFVNESEAIRFCKARMMKHLMGLVENAKKSIQQVKDFRAQNIELLNHKWTDREINKLERELAY